VKKTLSIFGSFIVDVLSPPSVWLGFRLAMNCRGRSTPKHSPLDAILAIMFSLSVVETVRGAI